MSLSGTLEELGLPDVLRLIARSRRTGSLRVAGEGLSGHVFFQEGELAYATTRSEDAFLGDLVRMGLVAEEQRSDLERRRVDLSDVIRAGPDRAKLVEFLEEQIKEVLARLLRLEEGRFEFQDGVEPQYETGRTFAVGKALEEATVRLSHWRDVEEVIPSPVIPLHMALRLPDGWEEVTLDELSWSLLACLDGETGIQEAARRLGMWQFPAAKTAARLAREGLIEVGEKGPGEPTEQAVEEPAPEPAGAERAEAEAGERGEEPAEDGEQDSPSELMRRWKELRSQR